MTAWMDLVMKIKKTHNLTLKDAMAKAKLQYKPKAKKGIKSGAVDPGAIIEGVKKVGQELSDVGKSVSGSILRKQLWDQMTEVLNRKLQQKGFSGFFDPRIQREWTNYLDIDGEGYQGAGLVSDINDWAIANETRRAINELRPRLAIAGWSYKKLANLLNVSLADMFPGVDVSDLN